MMEARQQKDLVLILAREFASKLATATFVADAGGTLVYFNEPAESLLGQSFAETGEVPMDEFALRFHMEDLEDRPMPAESRPGRTALNEQRPVHRDFRITALDGVRRELSATAIPLFSRPAELVGIMSIFWERQNSR
jgi:PAS domain-containing protein